MPTPEERIAELEAQLTQARQACEQERERAEKAEAEVRARWVAYFEFLKRTCKMSCGSYYYNCEWYESV